MPGHYLPNPIACCFTKGRSPNPPWTSVEVILPSLCTLLFSSQLKHSSRQKKRLNLNPWWKGLVIKAEIASGSYSHSQGYSSNMLQLRSLIFHILCVWWICVNSTTRVHSALGSPCTIEIITIFRICLKKSDITSTCLGLLAPCMSNIDRNNWRKTNIGRTWFPWKTKKIDRIGIIPTPVIPISMW